MLEETKRKIKIAIIIVLLLIIVYIVSIFVLTAAGARGSGNKKQLTELAQNKTPIIKVGKYYHLDRGVSSYSLLGSDKKGRRYYFIYRTYRKKAYLYPASKGYSESKIRAIFHSSNRAAQIRTVNLGWYHGMPVWEVAYEKNNRLGYELYSFKTGKRLSRIENL